MKKWKTIEWGADCPECGNRPMAFTDEPEDIACDGGEVKCSTDGCTETGNVSIDEEAYVYWHSDI